MVEHFNRSLLQLLRCYVDTEDDWECYLLLILYAYRTAQHSSTGVSPFQLMFGQPPQSAPMQQPTAFILLNYKQTNITAISHSRQKNWTLLTVYF